MVFIMHTCLSWVNNAFHYQWLEVDKVFKIVGVILKPKNCKFLKIIYCGYYFKK